MMTYTDMTKKALKLCFKAHKDQTDKSGMPYVFHPFHLAEQMPDEETTIVALLHDVVEDTPYTLDDLREMGFSEKVLAALTLMTHDKRIPYMDYVAKIKENKIAMTVKLVDLKHNSDLSRLDTVDEKALKRIEKYREAIALLTSNRQFVDAPSRKENGTIIITNNSASQTERTIVHPKPDGLTFRKENCIIYFTRKEVGLDE